MCVQFRVFSLCDIQTHFLRKKRFHMVFLPKDIDWFLRYVKFNCLPFSICTLLSFHIPIEVYFSRYPNISITWFLYFFLNFLISFLMYIFFTHQFSTNTWHTVSICSSNHATSLNGWIFGWVSCTILGLHFGINH